MERVLQFAKEQGYASAEYLGDWNGYRVYEPLFDGDGPVFTGLPLVILEKSGKVRMSTPDEAFAVTDALDSEE